MISNIPRKRLKERFVVEVEVYPNKGDHIWVSIWNNKDGQSLEYSVRVDQFDLCNVHHFEAILEAVLEAGIRQGKEEVRLALGMKE